MSKQMTEIRWHGRGGQGAKTACLLLADAAFSSGKYVQGFPEYGPERMGAPITAYNRISDVPCTIHSNIYQPDYVVVVDESLLSSVDVTAGLSPEGAVLINSPKAPGALRVLEPDQFAADMEASFRHKFATKPQVIEGNMKCLLQSMKEVRA